MHGGLTGTRLAGILQHIFFYSRWPSTMRRLSRPILNYRARLFSPNNCLAPVNVVILNRMLRTRASRVVKAVDQENEASLKKLNMEEYTPDTIHSSLYDILGVSKQGSLEILAEKNVDVQFKLLLEQLVELAVKKTKAKPRVYDDEDPMSERDLIDATAPINIFDTVFEMAEQLLGKPELIGNYEVDFLMKLFELAKTTKNPTKRIKNIYFSGKILYSLNKVRLDPFNEAVYIDALLCANKLDDATKLWKSRLSWKDVKQEKWWYELGITLYQKRLNMVEAEKLYSQMTLFSDDYLDPSNIHSFVKIYCNMKEFDKANKWINVLYEACEELNVDWKPKNQKSIKNFRDEVEINSSLNASIKPTKTQVLESISAFFLNGNSERGRDIIKKFDRLADKHSFKEIYLMHLIELPSEISDVIIPEIEVEKSKQPIPQKLFKKYQEKKAVIPASLQTRKFYQSWLESFEKYGDYKPQLKIIKEMIGQGKKIDSSFFQSILSSMLNKRDLDLAVSILNEMEKSYLASLPLEVLNSVNFKLLDLSFEEILAKKTAAEDKNVNSEIMPPVLPEIYTLFVSYFGKRKQNQYVDDLIERVQLLKIPFNRFLALSILNTFTRNRRFKPGIQFVHHLRSAEDYSTVQKSSTYYLFLWRFLFKFEALKRDQVEELRIPSQYLPDLNEIFEEMIHDENVTPNAFLYCQVINTTFHSGDYVMPVIILQHMGTINDIKPTLTLTSTCFELGSRIALRNSANASRKQKKSINNYISLLAKEFELRGDRYVQQFLQLLDHPEYQGIADGTFQKTRLPEFINQDSYDEPAVGTWLTPAVCLIGGIKSDGSITNFDSRLNELQDRYGMEKLTSRDIFEQYTQISSN